MANFWENDQQVTPAAQAPRSAPRPILSLPDLDQQADNARADRGQANSDTTTGIAVRGEVRDIDNTRFQHTQSLKSGYEALAPVKEYRTVLPQLIDALQTPADPSGDNALLYAYAKIMDPGSVVRESEQANAASGASVFDSTVANLKKQLGFTDGGLPQNIRDNLKRDALRRVQQIGQLYRQQRARYAADAQAEGIDPARVIGPDDFEPYLERFNQIRPDRQQGAQGGSGATGAPNGVNDPTMRGGLPVGTEIEWSADQREQPFDRTRYLQQNYGITPDQETQMVAFWNQNRGNPNLTPETAKQWFAANGIPSPSDADIANTIGLLRKGTQIAPIDTTAAEQQYRQRLQGDLQREGFDPTSGGSYAARAARGLELGLSDEIEGIGGGIEALLNNRGVADGYRLARDRSREAFTQMEDQQGALGTAAELAGGLVGGGVGASRAPITAGRAAREGAILGGVAGFGYGEGAGDSLAGAALGGSTGAGLGYGIGRGAEALAARRAASAAPDAASAYAQGQKFGVDLSLGDAGGMSAKATERLLDVQPGSAGVMNSARKRLGEQVEGAVDEVAGSFGPDTSFRGMGEAAQRGANQWMDRFNQVVGKAYDAVSIPAKAKAALTNTRQTLADLTDVFQSNPEMRKLMQNGRFSAFLRALTPDDVAEQGVQELTEAANRLRTARDQLQLARNTGGLQGDIGAAQREVAAAEQAVDAATQKAYTPPEGGELSWEDLKHFRSAIGEQMGEALLTDGSPKSQLRALYGALSRDMEATAASQNPKALAQFKRANDLFAQGQQRIEGAISSLIGNDSKGAPEKAAAFLQRIAKDGKGSADLNALAEVRKTLRPEEWSQVSNAFIRLIGQPANSAGREFNPSTFIRTYNDMTPAAKNLLFGGENKALRQNLDEFAQVIGRVAENNSTRNSSNTAMGLAGLTGYGIGGVPGLLAQALTSYGAAKLWTNPKFVRWATGYSKMLAGAARGGLDEAANGRQISALTRIAANDNAIAQDVIGLKSALEGVLEQSVQSAAAPAPTQNTRTGRETGERR